MGWSQIFNQHHDKHAYLSSGQQQNPKTNPTNFNGIVRLGWMWLKHQLWDVVVQDYRLDVINFNIMLG